MFPGTKYLTHIAVNKEMSETLLAWSNCLKCEQWGLHFRYSTPIIPEFIKFTS